MGDGCATKTSRNRGDKSVSKRQSMTDRQSRISLTFWQRLILVGAILLSGEALAFIIPSQAARANINCVAGNGGNGGNAVGGQEGAIGTESGNCNIGGHKTFSSGGAIQNNGNSGNNQS